MPFCEDCAKYWAPSAMRDDGTCPTCGRHLDVPKQASTVSSANAEATTRYTAKNLDLKRLAAGDAADADAKAPWHFKLLVFLLVVYLGWRVVDLFM
jgi:hypothetical protein